MTGTPGGALRARILDAPTIDPTLAEALASDAITPTWADTFATGTTWAQTAGLVPTAWAEIVAPIQEQARRVQAASDVLASEIRTTENAAHSHALAHLSAKTRAIAKGNAALAVRVVQVLTRLHAGDKPYTAALVALALRGDADAVRVLTEMHDAGDPLGSEVLGILADLEDLDARVAQVLDDVAAAVSAGVPVATPTDPPPPRRARIGTADPCAPPSRALCASGALSITETARDAERAAYEGR